MDGLLAKFGVRVGEMRDMLRPFFLESSVGVVGVTNMIGVAV